MAAAGDSVSPADLVELLPPAYTRAVSLIEFQVVRVPKSSGSDVLKLLQQEAPLGLDFVHLKRVRAPPGKTGDLEVLVGPASAQLPPKVASFLEARGFPECHRAKVPQHGALTRAQFSDWNQHWPLTYRKPSLEPLVLSDGFCQKYAKLYQRAVAVGGDRCGCVIVDKSGEEVATGRDVSDEHPLKHAVMVAIDSVAAARLDCSEAARPGRKRAHPDEEYLCQDFEVITTHEPCVMCSMALVHSRVRLVVYGHIDSEFGGLGGKFALHTCESLNHQFRVLRWMNPGGVVPPPDGPPESR